MNKQGERTRDRGPELESRGGIERQYSDTVKPNKPYIKPHGPGHVFVSHQRTRREKLDVSLL